MANNNDVVKDIYDALETLVQDTLGASWKKLPRVFEPETNDFRSGENGWGVRRGGASPAEAPLKHYALDHTHEIVLSRTVPNRMNDDEIQNAINDLYLQAQKIFVASLITKLSNPANVMIVNDPFSERPDILVNGTVILVSGFNVRYRNQINL